MSSWHYFLFQVLLGELAQVVKPQEFHLYSFCHLKLTLFSLCFFPEKLCCPTQQEVSTDTVKKNKKSLSKSLMMISIWPKIPKSFSQFSSIILIFRKHSATNGQAEILTKAP